MNNSDNSQLSKRERKLLKRQQKEQERLNIIRRKRLKSIIIASFFVVLVVGAAIFLMMNYSSEDNQATEKDSQGIPRIEINPREYDAGTVSMADGLVKHTYEIKNTGDADLKIDRIWTSCMCTTAHLKVENRTSPKFGMHTKSTFWSQVIASGKTGYLEVVFDPAFHGPQGTGAVARTVYLSTNDPKNQKAEVRLMANVAQ